VASKHFALRVRDLTHGDNVTVTAACRVCLLILTRPYVYAEEMPVLFANKHLHIVKKRV
jgi:hypothetical protein